MEAPVCPQLPTITGRELFCVLGDSMRSYDNLVTEGDWPADGKKDDLTVAQAAAEYNVAESTIRVWAHRGLIRPSRWRHHGRRKYPLYHSDDIAAVERAMRQSPNCRRAA